MAQSFEAQTGWVGKIMVRRARRMPFFRIGSLCILVAIGWGLADFDPFDVPELRPSATFSTSLPEAAAVEEGDRRCVAERPAPDPIRLFALWRMAPPTSVGPPRPRPPRDVVHVVAHPRNVASEEVTLPGAAADPARRHA
jgi:hypothetical protein